MTFLNGVLRSARGGYAHGCGNLSIPRGADSSLARTIDHRAEVINDLRAKIDHRAEVIGVLGANLEEYPGGRRRPRSEPRGIPWRASTSSDQPLRNTPRSLVASERTLRNTPRSLVASERALRNTPRSLVASERALRNISRSVATLERASRNTREVGGDSRASLEEYSRGRWRLSSGLRGRFARSLMTSDQPLRNASEVIDVLGANFEAFAKSIDCL
jgi:hypothetical protein